MKKYVTEFIGTFFLVLTIGLTGGMNALAIGSTLMVMIYAGGHVSGAHYNPAVTLAVYIRKRITAGDALIYMGSQVAGALVAALVVSIFVELPEKADDSHFVIGKALLAELLGTFALAYVVLNVATAKANAGNSYFGLAIGVTVFAMASMFGQFSGAFNPAVAIGAIVTNSIKFIDIWIYVVGCFGGGALAAVLFLAINPDEKRPITGPEDKID